MNWGFCFAFALTLGSLSPQAFAEQPLLVVTHPEVVFAPQGFDDNDNVELLLSGHFINTCNEMGPADFKVDLKTQTITLRSYSYLQTGGECFPTRTSYSKKVEIGVLPEGTYSVFAEKYDGTQVQMATLPVARALSQRPDELLYAPVSSVILEGNLLVIRGFFISNCMDLEEVRVMNTLPHQFEILPIVRMREEANCKNVTIAYEERIPMDLSSIKGPVLFHVRSLNGQSVNQVYWF